MTIDEAIERLQSRLSGYPREDASENMDDMKLGIEALKCVKEIRHHPFPDTVLKLPGETEE